MDGGKAQGAVPGSGLWELPDIFIECLSCSVLRHFACILPFGSPCGQV